MVVNKSGQMVSNIGNPIIKFDSAEEYERWKNSLPEGAKEEEFHLIFTYIPEVGSYFQADTLTELNSLPTEMKIEGVLYGAVNEKKLYHYNVALSEFVPFNS